MTALSHPHVVAAWPARSRGPRLRGLLRYRPAELRVIEHQALEGTDDVQRDPARKLAYAKGEVPADVRHWFLVASPSLFGWLERWLDHGTTVARSG